MIIVIMKMIVMSQMVLSDLMNVAGTTHLTPCSCTTVQVLREMLFADTIVAKGVKISIDQFFPPKN